MTLFRATANSGYGWLEWATGLHVDCTAYSGAMSEGEHGLNAYGRGCRCAVCKSANAERARDYRRRRTETGPPDSAHGTINAYQNYGCRCEQCRAAGAAANQAAYLARSGGVLKKPRLTTLEKESHGLYRYKNHGCRCEVCRAASRDESRRRREAGTHGNSGPVSAARALRSYHKTQADTLPAARRHGYRWTGPELELLSRDDLTLKQKSVMLGRTFSATRTMWARLKVDTKVILLAGVSR